MNNLKPFLIVLVLFCQNSFCQITKTIEVNNVRFKTQKLHDLLSANIADFKNRYNSEPKIVILTFKEKIEKIKNGDDERFEKSISLIVDVAVNYFMSEEEFEWFGRFEYGAKFQNTTLFLRDYDNLKFKDELFFFTDSDKILLEVGLAGNVASREWSYTYANKNFKLLETFAIEDIYKN